MWLLTKLKRKNQFYCWFKYLELEAWHDDASIPFDVDSIFSSLQPRYVFSIITLLFSTKPCSQVIIYACFKLLVWELCGYNILYSIVSALLDSYFVKVLRIIMSKQSYLFTEKISWVKMLLIFKKKKTGFIQKEIHAVKTHCAFNFKV